MIQRRLSMRQYKDGTISFSNEEQFCLAEKIIHEGYSITSILRSYNLNTHNKKYRKAVQDIIDRFQIDYYFCHRKYVFDDDYFNLIDSQEKAYWLGFLYADGYILKKSNIFGCGLQEKDVNHLKKFLNAININKNPLRYESTTNSYAFVLSSKILVEKLREYGFTNHKSYDDTDLVFTQIPDMYKKFFILGLWDGDGYVSISKEGKNLTGVVSNNETLLLSICQYVNHVFGEDFIKVTKHDGYPRIRLSTNKAYNFLLWLYDNANVYLDRKHEIFLKFSTGYYNKYNYHYIRKIQSGRFFVRLPAKFNNKTIGTFDTVKEAVDAYNKEAIKIGIPIQEYVGEDIKRNE